MKMRSGLGLLLKLALMVGLLAVTTGVLRLALLFPKGVVVTDVPYQVE